MKVIQTFSIGAAMMGMTCLVAVSAANGTQAGPSTDPALLAQVSGGTGGTGSAPIGGMPSGNAGSGMPSGSPDAGKGTAGTFPEKAKPGTGMDPQMRGTPGSSSGMTGTSAGSAGSLTAPTGGSPASGMSSGGSGSSSGSGGGGK